MKRPSSRSQIPTRDSFSPIWSLFALSPPSAPTRTTEDVVKSRLVNKQPLHVSGFKKGLSDTACTEHNHSFVHLNRLSFPAPLTLSIMASTLPAPVAATNTAVLADALAAAHITSPKKGDDELEEGEIPEGEADEKPEDDGKVKTVFDDAANFNVKVSD
jgi:hypothetical protein